MNKSVAHETNTASSTEQPRPAAASPRHRVQIRSTFVRLARRRGPAVEDPRKIGAE